MTHFLKSHLSTRRHALGLAVGISLMASTSSAACYADYKAKKDNPLKLHYGVIELNSGCNDQDAEAEINARIGRDGWVLLNVLSVFDDGGLAGKEQSAGKFYLRY